MTSKMKSESDKGGDKGDNRFNDIYIYIYYTTNYGQNGANVNSLSRRHVKHDE